MRRFSPHWMRPWPNTRRTPDSLWNSGALERAAAIRASLIAGSCQGTLVYLLSMVPFAPIPYPHEIQTALLRGRCNGGYTPTLIVHSHSFTFRFSCSRHPRSAGGSCTDHHTDPHTRAPSSAYYTKPTAARFYIYIFYILFLF